MPRVFISSTVYDFGDLRSALKFYLEQFGYDVSLSEVNDFNKNGNENSYDACLKAIEECDYFLLLLGSRVGGWADKHKKLTITMAEYRKARELFDAGKLRLLSFVRRDLWTIRDDRKQLESYLRDEFAKSKELSSSEIAQISKHASKFANDAEVLFGFIDEVARADEMRAAVEGKGPFPKGNWVHVFSEFSDIIDAVRSELDLPLTELRRESLTSLVASELQENVRHLLVASSSDGEAFPFTRLASAARKRFAGEPEDDSTYAVREVRALLFFSIYGRHAYRLRTTFLQEALRSGLFLSWDTSTSRYVETPLHRAMLTLQHSIALVADEKSHLSLADANRINAVVKDRHEDDEVSLNNFDVVPLVSLHDELQNVMVLSRRVFDALRRRVTDVELSGLRPRSPFPQQEAGIQRSTASAEDALRWLKALE